MELYNLEEIAREVGLSPSTLVGHRNRGLLPSPELEIGRLKFYSESQVGSIRAFYEGRKKYERHAGYCGKIDSAQWNDGEGESVPLHIQGESKPESGG